MATPAGQHEVIDLTLSDDSLSEEDNMGSGSEDHPTEYDGQSGDGDGGDSEGGDSDASEIEIHLSQETRTQLRQAIATISEARLRGLVNTLLETDQAIEIALTRELVTVKRESKRVVPRWATCANCEGDFDVNMTQGEDECVFHPGELEVNEEEFVDWDEDCHGPMDTAENQRQWPENFTWTCCDNNGVAEGCVKGEHKAQEVSKKRKRD